jgi:hypothetical protein
MTRGRRVRYSLPEMAWIERHRSLPRKEAHRLFREKFGREDVTLVHYNALCKRKGWLTGRDGRIVKGATSWNKGKAMPPGKGGNHPNARRTQFKKGTRQGIAVKLYKPIGTERVSKEGYLERKIHDGMPLQSRWRAVHLILWEEANGLVPEGMCLKCLVPHPGSGLSRKSEMPYLPDLSVLRRSTHGRDGREDHYQRTTTETA